MMKSQERFQRILQGLCCCDDLSTLSPSRADEPDIDTIGQGEEGRKALTSRTRLGGIDKVSNQDKTYFNELFQKI